MKKRAGDDSWRKRYVRLLTEPFNPEGADDEDLDAFEQLIDSGFIDGQFSRTHDGKPYGHTKGTTIAGRLFAEEQQEIISNNSLWGRIKSGSGLFIGWLAGVISSVLIHYLTNNG